MKAYQIISEVLHRDSYYPIVEIIKTFSNEELANEYLSKLLEDNKDLITNRNVKFKIQTVTIHDKL